MGRLESNDGKGRWPLAERCVIGRSRACGIRLEDARVSGEHALLRWNGHAWELQDLGSRNGTFVAGRLVAVGERVVLATGVGLGFGSSDGFRLTSAAPPAPFAVPLDGGPIVEAADGLLALPDTGDPELTVHLARDLGWVVEQGGQLAAVNDGATLQTAAGAWRLCVPEGLQPTADSVGDALTVGTIELRFAVSSDEEAVELLALHSRTVIDLKVRTHHYPLLLLARARLADRELPPERQGWVQQTELARQLRYEPDRLYSDIFRFRRQLAQAGVVDAGKVVERRAGTGLLRIGVARLSVVPLI